MPSWAPAWVRRVVRSRSAGEGVGSPDGWLCAITSATAFVRKAGRNTCEGRRVAAGVQPYLLASAAPMSPPRIMAPAGVFAASAARTSS